MPARARRGREEFVAVFVATAGLARADLAAGLGVALGAVGFFDALGRAARPPADGAVLVAAGLAAAGLVTAERFVPPLVAVGRLVVAAGFVVAPGLVVAARLVVAGLVAEARLGSVGFAAAGRLVVAGFVVAARLVVAGLVAAGRLAVTGFAAAGRLAVAGFAAAARLVVAGLVVIVGRLVAAGFVGAAFARPFRSLRGALRPLEPPAVRRTGRAIPAAAKWANVSSTERWTSA